jgi:hypothetical protein
MLHRSKPTIGVECYWHGVVHQMRVLGSRHPITAFFAPPLPMLHQMADEPTLIVSLVQGLSIGMILEPTEIEAASGVDLRTVLLGCIRRQHQTAGGSLGRPECRREESKKASDDDVPALAATARDAKRNVTGIGHVIAVKSEVLRLSADRQAYLW